MSSNKISRRDFLRAARNAGFVVAFSASGVPIVFAQDPTATPPPLPEGAAGKLTIIHKTEYVAEVQELCRSNVVQWAADNGFELDISTANPELFGDFTAKMLAAVQAGNPPDLGYHFLSIPQMYSLDIVEDVTDVVEQAMALYGPVVPPVLAELNAKINDRWWAVPFMSLTGAWMARRDVFEAAGIDIASIDTWEGRREAALAISDPDNSMWGWGFTLNRSGDGHGLILSVIQSFGGTFTDETGLVVNFNSPETIAAVEWLKETYTSDKYKPMLPPGVESWTDTSNNEAYLAGTIGLTLNQLSIYAKAKLDGNPVFENTTLLHAPRWLDGRLPEGGQNGWFTIFKGAKNIDAAKALILHMLNPETFTPMAQIGGGLFLPAYQNLWTDDLIAADPNFEVIRDIMFNPDVSYGRSHPAKPSALFDAIDASGITSQLMANVISGGMSVADAVQDAHDKIVQIWEEGGVPQA